MKYTFLLAVLLMGLNSNAQFFKSKSQVLFGKVKGDSLYRFKQYDAYNQLMIEGAYKDEARQLQEGVFSYYLYINDYNHYAKTFFDADKKTTFLIRRGSYHNGKMIGKWLEYYPNGVTKEEITYVNGIMQGPYFSYDESGKKIIEGNYVNNLRNGKWTYIEDLLQTRGENSLVITKKVFREYSNGKILRSDN